MPLGSLWNKPKQKSQELSTIKLENLEKTATEEQKEEQKNFTLDEGTLKETLKALALTFFSAAYSRLTSLKIENRIERINNETNSQAAANEQLSASIQQTADSFQKANENQERVNQSVLEGKRALESALGQLEISNNYISKLADVIKGLHERVEYIDKAVGVINDITGQTHILSLNASIEAARVGEQGKGFAIIASEVRKLSDNTNSSAGEIKNNALQINEGMKETVRAMEESSNSLKTSIEAAKEILNPFKEIEESTREMTEMIELLSSSAEEQTAAVQEMASHSTEIAEATNFSETVSRDTEANVSLSWQVADLAWKGILASIDEEELGLSLFLSKRLVDHAQWIYKFVSIFRDEKEENIELADYHKCKLGQWYYGEGSQIIKNYSKKAQDLFNKLEDPHRRVHVHGLQAIEELRKGNKDRVYEEIAGLTEASKEIEFTFIQLIDEVSDFSERNYNA